MASKNILKVKRDFFDQYLWVLTQDKQIYRINSITRKIDDLTSAFSAYSNFKFIDIAGLNEETVFIATNTTTLIQYKNGQVKTIGSNEGITTPINSIGINKNSMSDYYRFSPTIDKPSLMIGSDVVRYAYDIRAEKVHKFGYSLGSKIYDATYRTLLFKDSTNDASNNGARSRVPCLGVGKDNQYVCYLWQSDDEFGNSINTASMLSPSIYEYDGFSYYFDLLWGTKNGLFWVDLNSSFQDGHYRRYLEGIPVNKITDIYGLTAFSEGDWYHGNGMIRQNLLIGTDNGLYFSSSMYDGVSSDYIPIQLFHADELGSIKVNDISVNLASVGPPICEDGVWVATINGLYYLKPDWAQFITGGRVHEAFFKDAPLDQAELNICAGNTATAFANIPNNGGNSIQWYKDGQQLPGESGNELQINAAGEYHAVLYDPCQNIHLETNHLKAEIISAPVFSFNYPDLLAYCDSTSATLAIDYSPDYQYRWLKDNSYTGDVSYKMKALDNGKYRVEVSACDGTWLSSKEVEVVLNNLPLPVVAADKARYCEGEQAILSLNIPASADYHIRWLQNDQTIPGTDDKTSITCSATAEYKVELSSAVGTCGKTSFPVQIEFMQAPVFGLDHTGVIYLCEDEAFTLKVNAGTSYQYCWYKNGQPTGETGTSIKINGNGKYYVEASACENNWVPSAIADIKFISFSNVAISPGKAAYCKGDNASLSLHVDANDGYDIEWQRDGIAIPGFANQQKITTDMPGNYQALLSSMVKPGCIKLSTPYLLEFHDPPLAKITPTKQTSLCDGDAIELSVNDYGGTVKWSTGETTARTVVRHSGRYSVQVTSAAGCTVEDHIDLQLLPNPVLNVPDTSVCTFTKSNVVLTAPAGFAKYFWNGVEGNNSFSVSIPQTVTLKVEDSNGCAAIQNIVVGSNCPEVQMGNTFTPNNDGVNDTWTITGIANDATVHLDIYTRNGQEVYKSLGYYIPWDGKYRGKLLPPAVYYYVLSAKKGKQKLSGWVTILY